MPRPQPPLRPLPALLLPLLILGCREEGVRHYRVAKEAPAPRTAEPAAQGPLHWELPEGWKEEAGSGMRAASFKAPIAGDLDISVVVLGGMAGGETANVNRWRGQIGLPPLDDAAVAKARKMMATKAGEVAVFDFAGPKKRLVAGLLSTADGNTWFVKMVGEPAAVAKAAPAFGRLLESLHLG